MRAKQSGNIMAILLVILLVAFAVWVGFYVKDHRTANPLPSYTPKSSSAAGLSSGNDNQSLDSDLQTISNGLNQGDQNLQSSNNALNDQQLPVSE